MDEAQTKTIKKQLLEQIEKSNIPNKEEITSQITAMSSQELEAFLKEQNLMQEEGSCIFCAIADKKTPANILGENAFALAVLEINPISLGHTLIIPKIHSGEIPSQAKELATTLAEKLKILSPKKIDIVPSSLFGHTILNVLPVYQNETLQSPRKKASEHELRTITKKLSEQKKPVPQREEPKEKPEIISDKNTWLPKRLP